MAAGKACGVTSPRLIYCSLKTAVKKDPLFLIFGVDFQPHPALKGAIADEAHPHIIIFDEVSEEISDNEDRRGDALSAVAGS